MKPVAAGTLRTEVLMGTMITIQVAGRRADAEVDRAFDWFRRVESTCSRFDAGSELMQLARHAGEPVAVSPMLFEALQFAVAVAAETGGAFDPTVGHEMARRGFDREYSTGARLPVTGQERPDDDRPTFRDIEIDAAARTVTLRRPLTLDLGAVAKGLAIDMAARDLAPLRDFAIDAGGDLYLSGHNDAGEPWAVGIRHPRLHDRMIETIRVSGAAVCTSGDYERRGTDGEPHILDPRGDAGSGALASVTVIASNAMLADALATAAFVLGPDDGLRLLEREGVAGVMYSPALERRVTSTFPHA